MNKTFQMITARIVFTEPNGTQFLHCQMSQNKHSVFGGVESPTNFNERAFNLNGFV